MIVPKVSYTFQGGFYSFDTFVYWTKSLFDVFWLQCKLERDVGCGHISHSFSIHIIM